MYFQSDYILRMIEMMGDFFKRLLEMVDEALKEGEYDRLMRSQCGLDAKSSEQLSADSLIALLPEVPRFILSEMLYVRSRAFKLAEEEREECLYKALRLLLSAGTENLLCELRKDRLLELYNDSYAHLLSEDLVSVFRFLLLADDFAKAEDVLFDAIDTSGKESLHHVIHAGIEGFDKLQSYSDRELIAGGLSRDEVIETLAILKRINDHIP